METHCTLCAVTNSCKIFHSCFQPASDEILDYTLQTKGWNRVMKIDPTCVICVGKLVEEIAAKQQLIRWEQIQSYD